MKAQLDRKQNISTHTPLARRDAHVSVRPINPLNISTHTPLARRDQEMLNDQLKSIAKFQLTRLLRGVTLRAVLNYG